MKQFRQLVKELPSKKVVFAFGRYQPPTIGHGLLVAAVKHIAQKQEADHVIYASRSQDSKSNPLPVDRKVYYLKRMFPNTNFVAANDQIRTFIEAVKILNKKYKNLIMVAGSDRVGEYQKILDKYNGKDFHYDTIEVVSAGERDPDAEGASGMSGTKMREAAKKGDFTSFKKGLPSSLTTQDAKRLMNELREAMGVDAIKESVEFNKSDLREKYHAGEIFNVGESVRDDAGVYEIIDRGTNYITVVNESGDISKKWINMVEPVSTIEEDIQPGYAPEQITFKGYTTKSFDRSADAAKAFQGTIDRYKKGLIPNDPVAILNALKATDLYMEINDVHLAQDGKAPDLKEIKAWREAHAKARDSLLRIGEFMHHEDYWHMHEHELQALEANYNMATAGSDFAESNISQGSLKEMKFTPADKIRVARIIANTLGVADVDKKSSPEQLVNDALRKCRNMPMRPEYVSVLHNMLATAKEAGIGYNEKLVPQKAAEGVLQPRGDDKVIGEKKKMNEEISDILEQIATGSIIGKDTSGLRTRLARIRNAIAIPPDEEKQDMADQTDKLETLRGTPKINDSDIETEKAAENKDIAIGSSMTSGSESHSVRKQKIKYATESIELEEGSFKYHMDKAIAAHERGDDKNKEYHLNNARTAKFAMKTTDYAKNKELLDKHSQMTEELGQDIKKEYDAMKKYDIGTLRNMIKNQRRVSDVSEYRSKDHIISAYLRHKYGDKKVAAAMGLNEQDEIKEEVHRVSVTVADPHHPMVSKRKETMEKIVRVKGDSKEKAIDSAIAHHKRKGYKVHDHNYIGVVNEEAPLAKKDPVYKDGLNISEEDHEHDDNIEKELHAMIDDIDTLDDIIDAYEDDELVLVDAETGEEVKEDKKGMNEETLNEVLSRTERMRARVRFAKSASKRERRIKIALKSRSSSSTINSRARKLAIKMMKTKMAKRPLNTLSVGEKERIERAIHARKAVIDRMAMKLAPKIRKIEQERLSR
jgi:hypothetical protein